MRLITVIKLLLGVGTKENYSYSATEIFILGLGLLTVFFGSLLTIIFLISLYIK